MKRIDRIAAIALVAIVPFQTLARPLERHFGVGDSCYGRIYSEAHLSEHPDQTVTEIYFKHFPSEFGVFDENGQPHFDPENPYLSFIVRAKFRDTEAYYQDGGSCGPEGELYTCGIECDGGGFYLKDHSPNSILLLNDTGFAIAGCGSFNSRFLDPNPGDQVFRLDRLSPEACRP